MVKFIFNFRSNLQKTKKFFINKINFDGIPFSIEEEKILDCQYGKHYYKKKSAGNSKRQRFQGTKKIGCQARIKIKTFHLYPEYRITVDENKTHKERHNKITQYIYNLWDVHLIRAVDLKTLVQGWVHTAWFDLITVAWCTAFGHTSSVKVQHCYNGNTGGDHEEIRTAGSSTDCQQSFFVSSPGEVAKGVISKIWEWHKSYWRHL